VEPKSRKWKGSGRAVEGQWKGKEYVGIFTL